MYIISNVLIVIILHFLIIKEYTILQSYHYEFNRYLYHLKEKRAYYIFLYFLLFLFVIKVDILFIVFSIPLLIYLIKKYCINYTFRVKRLIITNLILVGLFLCLGIAKYVYALSFFYLCFLHYFSCFIEGVLSIKFLKKARRKIENKVVIGVTGSGGKTSVKNMLYDALINKYNVSKSPKSYNNKVGIIKSINECVKDYDDYFICEYGVDRVNGMDKLLKIAKPSIAIVTYIGNQHLLTFKSQENILNEKIKLITNLEKNGVGIINNDDPLLRNYNYGNKIIIRYGIDNESDVMGKNIYISTSYSEFDLYIKGIKIKRIKIFLLSRNAIENSLAVISALIAMNLEIEEIVKYIENITPITHRLEPKVIEGINVIDDSFNSNEKGFINALELLATSDKYKVIITPGIIEQGDNNNALNRRVAKQLLCCDFVCLVSENSKSIKEELDFLGYRKYRLFDSFQEAFSHVKKIDEDKLVLIENDLPDIYLN